MNGSDAPAFRRLVRRGMGPYIEAVDELLVAVALNDPIRLSRARKRMEEVIRNTMGVAELIGARQTLQATAKFMPKDPEQQAAFKREPRALMIFATETQTLLPNVTFEEAVENLVSRTPVTIRNAAERTAQRISQLYGEGNAIAFVRATEDSVTKRVQSLIEEGIREGIPEVTIGRRITMSANEISKRTADWTESYSRMAFRTNANTAVTAGRFRQAQDPAVKAVIPAFRFDAIGDNDTRHNHKSADGIIMRTDNPQWNKIAPPLGYNCRCQVTYMSVPQLRRMGRYNSDGTLREDRVPSSAFPDPGFRHGGRPDLFGPGGNAR